MRFLHLKNFKKQYKIKGTKFNKQYKIKGIMGGKEGMRSNQLKL